MEMRAGESSVAARISKTILGAAAAAASVFAVISLVKRRRQIIAAAETGESPLAEAEIEPVEPEVAPSLVTADLRVDERSGQGLRPELLLKLRLAGTDTVSVRHACLNWNAGEGRCCAHVGGVTTQSYRLSPAHPAVTYVFDACAPADVEQAIASRDLGLFVYSTEGPDVPIHAINRKMLLRQLERWLSALDSYYARNAFDRTVAMPDQQMVHRAA